jgi:hypothetical protein
LRELALYVAERSIGDIHFGAIKLNKLLFFSDFLHYGQTGAPITGATYRRRQFGPVPSELGAECHRLVAAGEACWQDQERLGYVQKRFIPLRKPDLSAFSANEIAQVDAVVFSLWDQSGRQVSDLSHESMLGWQLADDGDVIPYPAVFLSVQQPSAADIKRGQELARQYGW